MNVKAINENISYEKTYNLLNSIVKRVNPICIIENISYLIYFQMLPDVMHDYKKGEYSAIIKKFRRFTVIAIEKGNDNQFINITLQVMSQKIGSKSKYLIVEKSAKCEHEGWKSENVFHTHNYRKSSIKQLNCWVEKSDES